MKHKTMKKVTSLFGAIAACGFAVTSLYSGEKGAMREDGKQLHEAVTARNIEGMGFRGASGEGLGVVEDIVLSSDTGKIQSLVVGTGFLGIGGPEHVVDLSDVSTDSIDGNSLNSNLSESDLRDSKVFLKDRLDTTIDPDSDLRTGEISAMSLIGSDVSSIDGADLGEVHDWIVDIDSGYVPFVIIRRIDPLEDTEYDYFAVRSSKISGVDNGDLVADIDASDFAQATAIDEATPLRSAKNDEVHRFLYNSPDEVASTL